MEPLLERTAAIVHQFRNSPHDFPTLQSLMREALTGPLAEEIFGDEHASLQTDVEEMDPRDHAGVNIVIYNFSRALLVKHQELLSRAEPVHR